MTAFTEHETNILQKFRFGKKVTDEDEETVLDRYASIGFVSFGFDWDEMVETARLTDLGLKHLNR